MMPRLNGLEFVKWFRANTVDTFIPILMLTARREKDDCIAGFEVGIDDYVGKPFHVREVQMRVGALLRTKNLTSKLQASNKKLQEAQEELLRKERELTAMRFAGAAAHDLGQPVTSILLNCRVLEQRLADENGIREEATQAVHSIKRECKIVKEVLDKLNYADPHQTIDYVDGIEIASLESKKTKRP